MDSDPKHQNTAGESSPPLSPRPEEAQRSRKGYDAKQDRRYRERTPRQQRRQRRKVRMFEGGGPLDQTIARGRGYGTLSTSLGETRDRERDLLSPVGGSPATPTRVSLLDRLLIIRRYDDTVFQERERRIGRLPMLPRTKSWRAVKGGSRKGRGGSVGMDQDGGTGMSLGELVEGIAGRREGRVQVRTKGRFYIKASQVDLGGPYYLPVSEQVTERSALLANGKGVEMVGSKIDLEAGRGGMRGVFGSVDEERGGWPWIQIIGTITIVVFFVALFVLQRECANGRHC